MAFNSLPRGFLSELGLLSAVWSEIEQSVILHASAMAAVHTDGKTVDYLRMDFKRLREKWFGLTQRNFKTPKAQKIFKLLNDRLAKASRVKGDLLHSAWHREGRGKYLAICWEQKTGLTHRFVPMTNAELSGLNSELIALLADLRRATSTQ